MQKVIALLFLISLARPGFSQALPDSLTYPACRRVDPFWGCDGGNVFVGACSPFGMVRLGPDCPFPTPTSGYRPDKPILGFSHTHLSGTGGGGRYGNLQITPQFGNPNWKNRASQSKEDEMANPGYYAVQLGVAGGRIKTELTAFQNLGRSRITFKPEASKNPFPVSILLDLAHSISRNPRAMYQGSSIQVSPDGSFRGQASFKGGWGGDNPYTVFFQGQISLKTPKIAYKTDTVWQEPPDPAAKKKGKFRLDTGGVSFSGLLTEPESIETHLSISYKSIEECRFALEKSLKQTFDETLTKSRQAWEDRLSVLTPGKSVPAERKQMLTSALYHTLIMPTDVTGHHPGDQFGEAHFWEHYCLWDTFRTLFPLHNLLYPAEQKRMLGSLLRIGEKTGWLPDAWIAGDFAFAQGGCNGEVVLAEGVRKGLFLPSEVQRVWKVLYQNATRETPNPQWYGRHLQYQKQGFCDSRVVCGTSKSLEYAYNDHVLAELAHSMGKISEADRFKTRSFQVLNLWYPARKFFWSKDSAGAWMPGFTPEYMRKDHWNGPYFYEGNGWTYSLSAPHLSDTLRSLTGGNAAWESRLESLFNGNHFDMGNEPGFMLPLGYMSAGNPKKSTTRIHQLLETQFKPGKKGLPGQDDSGALSSWLVWGYLGLYPIAGTDEYWVTEPFLPELEVTLPGGKSLQVRKSGTVPFWNDKPLKGRKITHADILKGGNLTWKSAK